MNCAHCGNRLVKNGYNPRGSQKYRCTVCQRVTTPRPTPMGTPDELKQRALQLVLDGGSFRAAEQVPDRPARPVSPPEQVELDELFTFVGSKKRRLHLHGGRARNALFPELAGGDRAHRGRHPGPD